MINHGHTTWERPQKHDFGLIQASAGLQNLWRPNQTDNSRNKSCIGQIGAIWTRVLVFGGGKGPFNGYTIQKNSKIQKSRFFCVFFVFFVLLHRVPSATGKRNILCCRRGAPQAHCAAGAQRRRRVDPSRKQLVARAKRGSRALTRRGE